MIQFYDYLFFQQEIKHVTVPMLNRLIARNHNLAVVFMDENTSEGNMQYDKSTHENIKHH